ncbi:MAG: hypothetical protein HYU41_17320 [Candidatus Rokubacteria bacterium]|nr:hypothetical protein [Candidatus Rokubacteria bacterium]
MSAPPDAARAECLRVLDSTAAAGADPAPSDLAVLASAPAGALDDALRAFTDARGAASTDLLTRLAGDRADRGVRRAAKRALYRLAQRGITAPAPPPPRPVVARLPERPTRAWLSAIDGSGSRATWIVFEGAFGGLDLCSLILADTLGVVEVAGGEISKKRLAAELEALRRDQKLPWVATDAVRAAGLVAEALALHRTLGTSPPAAFDRWRPRFEHVAPAAPPAPPAAVDAALVERAAELLELPEMAGWFLEPEAVGGDAVELLQARESRLVVSEQIKAEREEALITRIVERDLDPAGRALWSRRLLEMALVFRVLGAAEQAALADAAAGALGDVTRDVGSQPFARALARRALEVAGEVALGRMSASEVTRRPGPVTRG